MEPQSVGLSTERRCLMATSLLSSLSFNCDIGLNNVYFLFLFYCVCINFVTCSLGNFILPCYLVYFFYGNQAILMITSSLTVSMRTNAKLRVEFSERKHRHYPSLGLAYAHLLAFRKTAQQLTCREQKACVKGGIRTK